MTAWVPWSGAKSAGPAEGAIQLWFFLSLNCASPHGSFKTWSAHSVVRKVFQSRRHPCAKLVIFVLLPICYRNCGRDQFYSRAVRLEKHNKDPFCIRGPEDWIPFLSLGTSPRGCSCSHWRSPSSATLKPLISPHTPTFIFIYFFFNFTPSEYSASPLLEDPHLLM